MRHFLLAELGSLALVAFALPSSSPLAGAFAAFLGFSIHWRWLDDLPDKAAQRISFLWFFIVQLIQLSWMSSIEYQGSLFLLLYVGLSAGMAWQFAFFTKQVRKVQVWNGWTLLSLASLWVLLEWSRLFFLCGFPFNFVGLFLTGFSAPLQCASLLGVWGLSCWVMLTNLCGLSVLRGKSSFRRWMLYGLVPYVVGGGFLAYKEKQGEICSVLLVQPGLSPAEKALLPGREKERIDPWKQWAFIVEECSKAQKGQVDLIVLPESCLPFGYRREVYDKQRVQAILVAWLGEAVQHCFPKTEENGVSNAYWFRVLADYLKTEIVVGLDTEEPEGYHNSVFYFQPSQERVERYDKRILLPIAESLPFSFLRKISALYGIEEFFVPGEQGVVWGEKAISPSICYEELFPSLMHSGRKKGAKLFVNLTNDGWYPSSSLGEVHLVQGRVRAVENGVPLVRACQTGVTAAIDSRGRIVARLGGKGKSEEVKGSLFVTLPLTQHRTFFSWLGESRCVAFFVFSCLGLFYRRVSSVFFREKGKGFFAKKRRKRGEIALDKKERNL